MAGGIERELVKVQRAIIPADAPWSVCDRKRQRHAMIKPAPEQVRALGAHLRAYFWATYDSGVWTILEVAQKREGWGWPR